MLTCVALFFWCPFAHSLQDFQWTSSNQAIILWWCISSHKNLFDNVISHSFC